MYLSRRKILYKKYDLKHTIGNNKYYIIDITNVYFLAIISPYQENAYM